MILCRYIHQTSAWWKKKEEVWKKKKIKSHTLWKKEGLFKEMKSLFFFLLYCCHLHQQIYKTIQSHYTPPKMYILLFDVHWKQKQIYISNHWRQDDLSEHTRKLFDSSTQRVGTNMSYYYWLIFSIYIYMGFGVMSHVHS